MTSPILLAGPKGIGKTSLAEAMADLALEPSSPISCSSTCILSFAQPIKGALCVLLGITKEQLEYAKGLDEPYTLPCGNKVHIRKALQDLGTQFGRGTLGYDIWINRLIQRANALPKGTLIIIDDCRFQNEWDAFASGIRVQLIAPPELDTSDPHESEQIPLFVGADLSDVYRWESHAEIMARNALGAWAAKHQPQKRYRPRSW